MRISARCDYACKALLELSLHWPRAVPLRIATISERQGIPTRYLVQILIQLKGLGLVASTRGKQGGYKLVLAPSGIRLGQVIRQVAGPLLPGADFGAGNGSLFPEIWHEVESAMAAVLDKVTFEDIANKARGTTKGLIYQS